MAYTFYNAYCGYTGATAHFVVKKLGSGIANGIVRDRSVTLLNIITCFSKNCITLTVLY